MKGFHLLRLALVVLALAGCHPASDSTHRELRSNNRSMKAAPPEPPPAPTPTSVPAWDPCAIILAPLASGDADAKLDAQVRRLQQAIPGARQPEILLERLGWLYVEKARSSFDPGFYKLAELCALCLDAKKPDSPEALLLRGHALQNLHRFHEAEPLARRLVDTRGLPFDHGLLGDVLMEQGRLSEAILEYQQMVDARPDAQAYARIAHVRWLKGDLPGAILVARMAAAAASAAEAAAWIQTRLGFYLFQAGERSAAEEACDQALALQQGYAPALLLRGRMRLASGDYVGAVELLEQACARNPLPEYQWTLAEALRAAQRPEAARRTEDQLLRSGAVNDPRTFALFLATRGLEPARAVALAEQELRERADVHTRDALAWALAATDRWDEALTHARQATAEGTKDPRLCFHAGLIARHLGRTIEAQTWLAEAARFAHLLLPSERAVVDAALSDRPTKTAALSTAP